MKSHVYSYTFIFKCDTIVTQNKCKKCTRYTVPIFLRINILHMRCNINAMSAKIDPFFFFEITSDSNEKDMDIKLAKSGLCCNTALRDRQG